MSYNIGPKIGIDGEAEFRRQISRINSEYKSMVSYTEAVTKAMEDNGDEQGKLEAQSKGLQKQLEVQNKKYEELGKALKKVYETFGAGSDEALRLEGAMFDTNSTIERLEMELDDTHKAMLKLADGMDEVGDASSEAEAEVLSFGDMLKAGIASGAILNAAERVIDVIVDIGTSAVEAAAEVKAANAQFEQTFSGLESQARSALQAVSSETGIAVTRLQSGYTSLYAFTKSVGGDSETALNIAQRALTAAADSAAYYDRTVEDATESLIAFLKGNYANDAALGIAATETTRNAKANELYAKSFSELTEAQKVDTLLAMVEAGNAASGALGSAAREADEWTNATGELSEATTQLLAALGGPVLQGLTPLIQGITESIYKLIDASEWQALNTSVEAFSASITQGSDAMASANAEMDATAALADRYVQRLRELEVTGLDTAEAQREYAQTVGLLNALMPELGLTINDVTGRLDQNTLAIESNIDALKEQARQQAQQEYYSSILDAYNQAYQDLYAAETRRNQLLAQEQVLIDNGAKSYAAYTASELGAAGAAAELASSMTAEDRALMEVQTELAALNGSIANTNEVIAAHEAELDAAAAATDSLTSSTKALTGASSETADALTALDEAYAEAKAAARESIDQQIGLFDELATESEMSASEIVANWEKQRAAFDAYSDNLQKAVDMGLDEALVQQLADGSEQSMLILNELVNSTEVNIDEINAAFRRLDESRDTVAETMADIEKIAEGTYSELVSGAQNAGYNTGAGVADGIRSSTILVENAMNTLGKKAQAAYNRTMEIHSPSKVMEKSGDYTADGVINRIIARTRDMEAAMEGMATAGVSAYTQALADDAMYFPTAVAERGSSNTTNTTNNTYNSGGISVNVYAQDGQSAREVANAVVDIITTQLQQEVAAFG